MKRVCLVTTAHISYNPRLLKEADALDAAGFNVRVVSLAQEPEKSLLDARLMQTRKWRLDIVRATRTGPDATRWLTASARQALSTRALSVTGRWWILERAYSRFFDELARAAMREYADMFIAHNLPALPPAALAARKWHAKLGFDAEDYHRGEFAPDEAVSRTAWATRAVEEKYITQCDHVTTASDQIADAYAHDLKIKRPVTILNVFSLNERHGRTPLAQLANERKGSGLSLYWYSQTIGEDRGLDDALRALALLRPAARLHLRGKWARGYKEQLRDRAAELGIADYVHALKPAPPEQLVERALQHDVGLALEPGTIPNRALTVTNKVFVYLVAGLAIAASDVPGQAAVLCELPGCGFVYPAGNAESLAAGLRCWIDDPAKLNQARAASRLAAEQRYSWDRESEKLVGAVKCVLDD